MEIAPILLFTYNRPAHTRRLLESLLRNSLAAESELYVYSDAPRDDTDREAVDEVRQALRTVEGFKAVHVVMRDTNQGLARNVIDGVTHVVGRHGRVIVVEDDLVVAPHFLQFMNDALETFKDDERIGHIHACEFTRDPALPETFLIRWAGSWGWATWARAWQHFNPDGKALLDELHRRRLTRDFDFGGTYGYTRMLRRQVEGRNHSWAIRWNASLFLDGLLSLNAGRSLVQNMGFDGSGTHCGNDSLYATRLFPDRLAVDPGMEVAENPAARKAMADYYRRTNSFWSKAMRRLKKEMGRLWKTN